jgi:hypothetical protein
MKDSVRLNKNFAVPMENSSQIISEIKPKIGEITKSHLTK